MARRHATLTLILAVLLAGLALADTIVMKDGRRITGKIVRQDRSKIVVQSGVGELELLRAEIDEIIAKKTPREEYAERAERAKTADDWHALGVWAQAERLKSQAKKAYQRALELDPQHDGANPALGNVRYAGEWMSPAARDQRAAQDHAAEMRAQGLVEHEGEWVSVANKARLEDGQVLVDGEWLAGDEARRAQGLELYEGQWLPRSEALGLLSLAAVQDLLGEELPSVSNAEAFVAGPFEVDFLREVADGLQTGRGIFNGLFGAEPGLELIGGRRAEFFVFGRDAIPYEKTVPHFVSLTPTLPEAAVPSIQASDGLYWWDPYVLSSARLAQRGPEHLRGHCLHHWGHLLLNSRGYDGRLLPPWYDEGFAAYLEYAVFERNYVFCSTTETISSVGSGSRAGGGKAVEFNSQSFRLGSWKQALEDALAVGGVRRFDKLCQLELPELELLDIATSAMILHWIAEAGGEAAELPDGAGSPAGAATPLQRFHEIVRRGQPAAPLRVERDVRKRLALYDEAFGASMGMTWKQADEAWRAWFLAQ